MLPLIPQLCILWGLPSSRWKQLVNNRRNAWQQVSYWVISLTFISIVPSSTRFWELTQCLLAIFCLLCLKYSIVSAASGRMIFHLHLPNLFFFFIYLVPIEHNKRAKVCRSTLTCSHFHSWLCFVNSISTEKRSDETIAGAVITHIQNSCSLFSWVHNSSRFLSYYYLITCMQFLLTFI